MLIEPAGVILTDGVTPIVKFNVAVLSHPAALVPIQVYVPLEV